VKIPGPPASRLASTFLLGCLLFNFPLIALFNVQGAVLGIPVLYAYLFAAWALLIALVAVLFERAD
jgi:predicted permease